MLKLRLYSVKAISKRFNIDFNMEIPYSSRENSEVFGDRLANKAKRIARERVCGDAVTISEIKFVSEKDLG